MCGICGIVHKDSGTYVDSSIVERMVGSLRHRGPDDSGSWVSRNVGLGHTRLSIIDLSADGHQPMCNEDGSVWLTFNGEIYNFAEIRQWLHGRGHSFRSNSDSEVLVHLWEEEKEKCLEKLNGMFAFAIWDRNDEMLFLARDRIGQKPLFYGEWDDVFAFGSEVKAVQQVPSFEAKPNVRAIHYYLTYQSVPHPYSAFEGVHKLPPAHYLVYRNGNSRIQRYWDFSYEEQFSGNVNENEVADELIEQLKTSIGRRMVSDVPIGSFLSGGIDSSLISALMAEIAGRRIRTFSIGFNEEEYDETKYAKMVSERYDTDHTVLVVKPEVHEIVDDLVWYYNEPFADSSAIPTFYLSKMASEHVKVVLTGDGGDENFAGYSRYLNEGDFALGRDKLSLPQRAYAAYCSRKPFYSSMCSWGQNLRRYARLSEQNMLYYYRITHFHEQYQKQLYTDDMWELIGDNAGVDFMLDKYAHFRSGTFLDRTLGVDLTHYMPDTLMVKTDTASMAHGLEARSPMLDHEFIEFATRVPSSLKIRDGKVSKYILKKASEKYLPHNVIYREKMGFGVPLDRWFRSELKDFAYDILLGEKAAQRGYFCQEYVKSILDRHQLNTGECWHYMIWNLLVLELWLRKFIDKDEK